MIFFGNLPLQRASTEVFIYSPKSQISWKYASLCVSLSGHGSLQYSLSLCILPLLKTTIATFTVTAYPQRVEINSFSCI